MNSFKEDFYRYNSNVSVYRVLFGRNHVLKGILFGRLANSFRNRVFKSFFHNASIKLLRKNCVEIPSFKHIGGGLLLAHPYCITINANAHIGKEFTIFKGATVGSVRSGRLKGTPTIGDRVTLCNNAFVCGNITIGNDVLIASGAFVDFDVPSNSLVIGNPGVVHHKENASKDYL